MSWRDRIAQAIRAYHGSPHSFDKFDIAKIGTGEGAQAYGHGLYFAENPAVAEAYKFSPQMNMFARANEPWSSAQRDAADWFYHKKQDPARAVADLEERIGNARMYGDTPESTAHLREVQGLLKGGWEPPRSHMYEVNINARPEQFIDWDKPLRDQPALQPLAEKLWTGGVPTTNKYGENLKGRDFYNLATERVGGIMFKPELKASGIEGTALGGTPEIAGRYLTSQGFPGIKYLDQGSRSAGGGSSNYVVFDPGIVDIVRKYGIPGVSTTGMGALAAQDQYGAQP